MYIRGRWGWRWDSGNQCVNNSGGQVLNWDVFVEGKGCKWVMLNDVGGVGRDGRDGAGEFVNEMVASGDVVLFVNDVGMGRLDDEVIEVVAGEFLGCNIGKDVEESLVINERGRRARDKDRSRGRGHATGVSGGWDVPGVVGTVEKVLNLLGGGGEVGCVDVING